MGVEVKTKLKLEIQGNGLYKKKNNKNPQKPKTHPK